MEQNWKEITTDLYSKIAPIGGVLHSQIDNSFPRTKKILNIWIEFQMNDFIYNDPFYGEQKSTDPFNMCVELYDYTSSLEINSIYDLQGKTIEGKKEDRIGSFSNSLHFTVPSLRFGKIDNSEIEVHLEYSLTNSESYGMMNGSILDHIQDKEIIKTKLLVKELVLVCPNELEPKEIAKYLDSSSYDYTKIELATDLNWSTDRSKGFYVKYKVQDDNKGKSKSWKFWK